MPAKEGVTTGHEGRDVREGKIVTSRKSAKTTPRVARGDVPGYETGHGHTSTAHLRWHIHEYLVFADPLCCWPTSTLVIHFPEGL